MMIMVKKYWWSILLILWVGFIFGNSLVPAAESAKQSEFVLSLIKRIPESFTSGQLGISEHIIRKAAHVTEYTIMGILLYQTLAQYSLLPRERWGLHVLLGVLVPLLDETIQLFISGRSGQISDVWLNCSGVVLGTVMMLLWTAGKVRRKRRS